MVCAALSVPRHAINRSPNTTHDASKALELQYRDRCSPAVRYSTTSQRVR